MLCFGAMLGRPFLMLQLGYIRVSLESTVGHCIRTAGEGSREQRGYDPLLLLPLFILISQDPDLRLRRSAHDSGDTKQTVVMTAAIGRAADFGR
jgi:hypothetical protein